MDDGDEEITLGELHAGHLGRVIAIGREDFFPSLVGAPVGLRHRYAKRSDAGPGEVTEVTIRWRYGEDVVIEQASTERVVVVSNERWRGEPFVFPFDELDRE